MSTVVLGLGSNLGSRHGFLRSAVALLEARAPVRVTGRSAVYETEPMGPPQPAFLNAAVRVETGLSLHELLDHTRSVERALGRRRGVRWGPRTLDVDLLWSSAPPLQNSELTVPHPRLHERSFALAPLLDVAPEAGPRWERALAEVGGRPPRATELDPAGEPRLEPPGTIEAAGLDELDALATAAEGLPALLGSCPEPGELELLEREGTGEPAALLFNWVLDALASGQHVASAALLAGDGPVRAWLLGRACASVRASERPSWSVRAIPGGVRVHVRVDGGPPNGGCAPEPR